MINELLREKYIDFNKLFAVKGESIKNKHIITDAEWYKCKKYFNFSCAYCGMSEELQKSISNKSLTKEHVENHGSDYLDNCVPSCNRCNTSKGSKNFEDWYKNNINYSDVKYYRIIKWLEEDCHLIKE